MKKILAVFVLFVSAVLFPVCAGAEDSPFEYTVKDDGTIIITGYDGYPEGTLRIPSQIDGYTVTEIGELSFTLSYDLTELIVADSVVKIDKVAFTDCHRLEKVTIGKNTEIIGKAAFRDCYELKEVTLGENTKIIEDDGFSGCPVKKLYVPRGFERFGETAFYLFLEDMELTVNYGGSRSEWNSIDFDFPNHELKDATIVCFANADGTINEEEKEADMLWLIPVVAFGAAVIAAGIVLATIKPKNVCRSCGANCEKDSKFCTNCGNKL